MNGRIGEKEGGKNGRKEQRTKGAKEGRKKIMKIHDPSDPIHI
jgi:hypothetical protein